MDSINRIFFHRVELNVNFFITVKNYVTNRLALVTSLLASHLKEKQTKRRQGVRWVVDGSRLCKKLHIG